MLWDWKAKIKWHRPAKRINHASRITIPTEVANGRPMARMPQISMTTPQTIDQPLAFLTEPRVVSEFICWFSFACFRSDYRNDYTNTRLVVSVTPDALKTDLTEQAALIQKVSEVELNRPAPQVAENNQ